MFRAGNVNYQDTDYTQKLGKSSQKNWWYNIGKNKRKSEIILDTGWTNSIKVMFGCC